MISIIKSKNWLILPFILCLSISSSAQTDWPNTPIAGPGGIQTTCHDLDSIGSPQPGSDGAQFNIEQGQWTPQMISFLIGLTYHCQDRLIRDLAREKRITPQVVDLIHDRSERTISKLRAVMSQNDRAAKAAEADARAKQKSDRNAKEQSLAEARRLLADCENTREYRFYDAEDTVIQDIDVLHGWEDNARQERRVSNAGGVRNLSNEYINAQGKISAEDALKEAWADYKSLGGKASSPQKVRHRSADPCIALRTPEISSAP